jgi:PPOX class probable F420-dependent enzyme
VTNVEMARDPLEVALKREEGAWARDHLERDVVAWLTTVAPDGRVQSSVISFLFDQGRLYFYSQPGTPKLRNIGHSPLVSFHLDTDPYGDHMFIVEGTAVIDPTIVPLAENERATSRSTPSPTRIGVWTSTRPGAYSASRSGSCPRGSVSAERRRG